MLLLSALASLVLALWVHLLNDFAPLDVYFPPATPDPAVEQHYSASYYDARALFRSRAVSLAKTSHHNVTLHSLPLPDYDFLDLTIDAVVVHGAKDRAVVHISGTHGVEGFAGSAIQSAILEKLSKKEVRNDDKTPTIIFVHALNPYGFSKLRRFNENNVDLNRNFLWPEDFERLRAEGSNVFGYDDIREALNPSTPASWKTWISTWYGILSTITTKGFVVGKRAVAGGNYHYPETVYYGGDKQQPSVLLLFDLLRDQLDMSALKSVGILDVHTGGGPPGHDTLMLSADGNREAAHRAREIFSDRKVVVVGDQDDGVAEGFDAARGVLCGGMSRFLPDRVTVDCAVQEFGTAPGVFVLLATIQENAMYQHAPSRRIPYAEKLRDVFYFHRSAQWKSDVIDHGVSAFEQLVAAHSGKS